MTSEGMYSIVIGGSWNKVLVLYTPATAAHSAPPIVIYHTVSRIRLNM